MRSFHTLDLEAGEKFQNNTSTQTSDAVPTINSLPCVHLEPLDVLIPYISQIKHLYPSLSFMYYLNVLLEANTAFEWNHGLINGTLLKPSRSWTGRQAPAMMLCRQPSLLQVRMVDIFSSLSWGWQVESYLCTSTEWKCQSQSSCMKHWFLMLKLKSLPSLWKFMTTFPFTRWVDQCLKLRWSGWWGVADNTS